MERKKGEIFEYNGEWYQCVIGYSCNDCAFSNDNCEERERITLKNKLTKEEVTGFCTSRLRSDGKSVIFKKLEKVGEPYMLEDKKFQKYKVFKTPYIYHKIDCSWQSFSDPYYISLEIKEDMEEKKLNLKPFDIQKAREGKPVCTRDGRKARILCFDLKNNVCPIVAAVEENNMEVLYHYDTKGLNCYKKSEIDLMMLPDKKERWINVYKELCYESKEEAIRHIAPGTHYIGTIKVEWEE